MRHAFAFLCVLIISSQAAASGMSHDHAANPANHQPYAGLESRAIKALSDADMVDLQAGKGMGLALAAELNGYPGPVHVLAFADALGLDSAQRAATERAYADMQSAAVAHGTELIAAEKQLDRLFAHKHATPAAVQKLTAQAAEIRGQLRATHLSYHLTMAEILRPEQIRKYEELRGYR